MKSVVMYSEMDEGEKRREQQAKEFVEICVGIVRRASSSSPPNVQTEEDIGGADGLGRTGVAMGKTLSTHGADGGGEMCNSSSSTSATMTAFATATGGASVAVDGGWFAFIPLFFPAR